MKHTICSLTVLFVILVSSFSSKASGPYELEYDSLSCLQIEGKVANAEDGEDGECMVELISANEIKSSIILKEGKSRFKFVLSKNTFYSIRISKKGFVTKLISIDTELLTEQEGIHLFKFDTKLISEAVGAKLNQEVIDFPVTIIQFSYETDSFEHNSTYTAYIKRELYKKGPSRKTLPTQLRPVDTTDLAMLSK